MELNTTRLHLRRFTLADAPFLLKLLNTEGWKRNIGDRHVHTVEAAEKYLEERLFKGYIEGGMGFLLVELKEDGTPIGMSGTIKREALDHPDIGFAFLPEYFGKGYALESSIEVKRYAEEVLGYTTITGITLPENTPSIRLLEKLGLKFEKMVKDEGEDLMLFTT